MPYKDIKDIPINLKGRVAIKLHMGDDCIKGRHTHVSPQDVKVLIDKIKANGGEPFLVDTTVLYKRRRNTVEGYMEVAKANGFGGFPIKIDGPDDFVEVSMDGIPPIKVSKFIAKADALLVLSHATGHGFTGFAGVIKNLGMGGVVKEGKARIHGPCAPRYDEDKCVSCGKCAEACPHEVIVMEGGKPRFYREKCPACGRCLKACKTGALYVAEGALEKSFNELANAAKAVLSIFKPENTLYITVLKNITRLCDCAVDTGEIVCRDMGYLTGDNPLKLDIETANMIKEQNPDALDFKTWDLFVKTVRKHF